MTCLLPILRVNIPTFAIGQPFYNHKGVEELEFTRAVEEIEKVKSHDESEVDRLGRDLLVPVGEGGNSPYSNGDVDSIDIGQGFRRPAPSLSPPFPSASVISQMDVHAYPGQGLSLSQLVFALNEELKRISHCPP